MSALLTNATQRGWGNPGAPGSVAGKTYARNIVRVNVPLANGATIAVSVHRDIAAIVYAAIHEASTVFTFNRVADDWGYAHRFIRGSKTTLSNHCLGGDTLVTTHDGPIRIADLAGTTARLLTRDPESERNGGRWVDADVSAYGTERVADVLLRNGSDQLTITASLPHRWFVRTATGAVEKTTAELEPGDRLATCTPFRPSRVNPSPFGIMHGITFGDGTRQPGAGTKVTLWNAKRDLCRWFPPNLPMSARSRDSGCEGIEIRSLPADWKDWPTDQAPAYMAGFLAGYIATDGHVRAGEVRLSSRSREQLEAVAVMAARFGIASRFPKVQKQSGGYLPDDQWSMQFVAETVPEWLLIRPGQHEAFDFGRTTRRTPDWAVVGVIDHGASEPVYCATVPGTGAFTLHGNLLTGNSWGLAIDLDATTNPMQARKPGKPIARTVTDRVVAVMAAHGFFWGGLYATRPDPMHFEISLTRAQARVMGAALIAAGKAPASLAPTKG